LKKNEETLIFIEISNFSKFRKEVVYSFQNMPPMIQVHEKVMQCPKG